MRRGWIVLFGVGGWLVSYWMFGIWMFDSGFDFWGGWVDAFTASTWGTGLIYDLCAVTNIMIVLAIFDRKRLGPKWTAAVVLTLGLSVSMSLMCYLLGITADAD